MSATRDVAVSLGARSYTIRIGRDVLADLGALVRERVEDLARVGTVVLVTNPIVARLYATAAREALASAGASRIVTAEIPDGEPHKTLETVASIYDRALDAGVDRSSLIVALGGGVVGDAAGFAAATLLRGLRLVMVPTTLLAQVDSSVGGKTGVNRAQGKNLVGAFHQPSLVVADTETLATLPDREYRAGLAEVVKYGVILDEKLFESLERRTDAVRARDPEVMTEVVARCAALKAYIVERDETESGLRRILNFGHTLGHAVEQATGYSRYLHGEAVAMGMVAAARLSARTGACDGAVVSRLAKLIERLGLETEIPRDIAREHLERAVAADKKAQRDRVSFIVCTAIGSCREQPLAPADIVAGL